MLKGAINKCDFKSIDSTHYLKERQAMGQVKMKK
jgi:hypothetical protein